MKIFFTWWNKQTIGTLLKTFFTGKMVGKDEFGNRYYKNKIDERWVIYSSEIEATKITSDWYLWMHHTIDKIPDDKSEKIRLAKKHLENKTGTEEKHKPIKLKIMLIRNIALGNNLKYLAILISFFFSFPSFSENEIVSSPLINLEQLKPSFEDTENDSDNFSNEKQLKNKKN